MAAVLRNESLLPRNGIAARRLAEIGTPLVLERAAAAARPLWHVECEA